MNKIFLKGNLGKDPEIKTFDWGKVAKFSLATSESYKNKQGEKITETDWHNIVFRGSVCDIIEKYVHKGDQIIVEGKIKYRNYENKEGITIYTTDIVCSAFEFCSTKERVEVEDKQGEWKKGEKRQVSSMSDASELPGYVNDGSVPDDPF